MIDYRANPFFLNDEDIRWVEKTAAAMSVDKKIGQIFCPLIFDRDPDKVTAMEKQYQFGGAVIGGSMSSREEGRQTRQALQRGAAVPLLLAEDLESGGNGACREGTCFGTPMLVSATGDAEQAYRLGCVCAEEGLADGVNWSFGPVVDLDRNYHNPIVNVRSFGSDEETVIRMAREYLRAFRENGAATACKHFPGDGIDERDQHLCTTVNTLSCEEWDRTYGKVYQSMIEAGTLSIMVAHIAQPAYEERFDGHPADRIMPASQSRNLMQKLLRGRLGFNGLIVSDATPMCGFCSAMERRKAIPLCIEHGIDMLLFNRNIGEDLHYMKEGLENGILSMERLDEAVRRILAMKAALHLQDRIGMDGLDRRAKGLDAIGSAEHAAWAAGCADKGITLVKDTQHLLPLDPMRYRRVLLEILGTFPSNDRVTARMKQDLERAGFAVTLYEKEGPEAMGMPVEELRRSFDLVLYVCNIETEPAHTTARLQWNTVAGLLNNIPWMVHEIPTLMVSLGNPYHLLDAPMIKTYVNAYCNSDTVIDAVLEKLLGRSVFQGQSPVDPFCGKMDLRF